jgi:SMI1 / KNR4 family (SUKH-1)
LELVRLNRFWCGQAEAILSMNDRDSFWAEPGTAPGMDQDQTEDYLRQVEAGHREKGDAVIGEAFVVHARSLLNPPRPGPDEATIDSREQGHGVRLPSTLRDALQIQDGGYVAGTRLQLYRLSQIESLSGEGYAHMWENEDNREFGDPSKLHLVGMDEAHGGLLVLDYNTGPEPRVLWLWRDLGDELRDEGDGTFDRMIVRQREMMLRLERGDKAGRKHKK